MALVWARRWEEEECEEERPSPRPSPRGRGRGRKTPSVRFADTSPRGPGEARRVAEVLFAELIAAWWARSAASLRVERDWRWRVDSMVGVRAALMVWIAVVAAR